MNSFLFINSNLVLSSRAIASERTLQNLLTYRQQKEKKAVQNRYHEKQRDWQYHVKKVKGTEKIKVSKRWNLRKSHEHSELVKFQEEVSQCPGLVKSWVNVHYWHVYSHVKDSKAAPRPTGVAQPSPSQAQRDDKAFPGSKWECWTPKK